MKTKLLLPALILGSSPFFNSCINQIKKDLNNNLSIQKMNSKPTDNNIFEHKDISNKTIKSILSNMMKEKKDTTLSLLEQWIYQNPDNIDESIIQECINQYKKWSNEIDIQWKIYMIELIENINSNNSSKEVIIIEKKIPKNSFCIDPSKEPRPKYEVIPFSLP